MKRFLGVVAALITATAYAQTPQPFTLKQALSAPYATDLAAAPVGNLFAWVEDEEGRHNLYVGGPDTPARSLSHNTEDDAQDISQIAWSPDAKTIAYTYGAPTGADGKPANPAHLQRPTPVRVVLVSTDGSTQPVVIGEGRAPLFARDGHSLLFVREGQIWVAELGSQATQHQLVYDRGSASSLTLSPDGGTLAFISRRREANERSHMLLSLFDMKTHVLTFPAPSTGDDSAPAFSPDGKQLAWIQSPFTDIAEFANPRTNATPWSIRLLDLADGKTQTLYSPEANKRGSVLPDLSTGSPYLLWTADHHIVFYSEADGWLHLYALDPGSSKPAVLLTPGNFDVEGATLDRTRSTIYFASNQPGGDPRNTDRRHIRQVSTATAPTSVGMTKIGIEVAPQASTEVLGAMLSGVMYPMHPAFFSDGHWTFLHEFDPGKTGYPDGGFVEPRQALFDSSDGMHLHGQLFLSRQKTGPSPSDKLRARDDKVERVGKEKAGTEDAVTKHPAIIFVHGGPKRQMLLGYPGMEYYSNAYAMNQYLASRGFIVLSVNYRCGIGYGLEFRACQNAGATGAVEYNDVLAAQKYLASRPDVDVKRIGIWGGSYGGYLTALALARNSDLFAAGVDFHGVHDWNLEDNAGDWKRGSFAEQDRIGAKALKSSPLADISRWRSPILLIHGDNDPDVAYAQTPLLADALRARNASLPKSEQIDVEERIFPDEVHEFALHKDWLAAYEAAAAFFERTLKPEPVK